MKMGRESGERENGPADSVWETVEFLRAPQFSEGEEYNICMHYGIQVTHL